MLNNFTTNSDDHSKQTDYVASSSTLVSMTANNDQFVSTRIAVGGSAGVSLVRYAVQLVLYKPVNADF
jgi:hypothetical protein